ncbi:CPSF A subunit region-domain-containing protein [Lactarius indigo]|nr:CPSF A subunit region-domain-containing protein [Lactarius indigo]
MQTEIDDVPLTLLTFQGRLVAGVGKALGIYDIGKKKMLRKAENKKRCRETIGSAIVTLSTQGSRILIGDIQESVYYAFYEAPENWLFVLVFADDAQPRWITCSTMWITRPWHREIVSDRVGEDPTGAGILHEKGLFMGASHETQLLVSMVAGGREVLRFHGTIGVPVPLASKEDVNFISTLEQYVRTKQTSLIGRDHLDLAWRLPVVDGHAATGQAEHNCGRARPIRRQVL